MGSISPRQAMIRRYKYGMPTVGTSFWPIRAIPIGSTLWHGLLMGSVLLPGRAMAIRMGWIIVCAYGIPPLEIRSIFIMVIVTLCILWHGHQTAPASSPQAGVIVCKFGMRYRLG